MIEQYFLDNPIPTDYHSYQALEAFWGYDHFTRLRHGELWTTPALVISGGKNPSFSSAMGEKLASHFHTSKHLHLPEARHLHMVEYPEEVNAAIEEWRGRLAKAQPSGLK